MNMRLSTFIVSVFSALMLFAHSASAQVKDYAFPTLSCEATHWGDKCQQTQKFSLAKGLKYCRHRVDITHGPTREATYEVLGNDAMSVTVKVRAEGGSIIDQYGSDISVIVTVSAIPDGDDYAKYGDACIAKEKWVVSSDLCLCFKNIPASFDVDGASSCLATGGGTRCVPNPGISFAAACRPSANSCETWASQECKALPDSSQTKYRYLKQAKICITP